MIAPVSICLESDIKELLEDEARQHQMGLSSYLRQLATEAAVRVRRERILRQSAQVGDYVQESPQARGFYEDWGGLLTPDSE